MKILVACDKCGVELKAEQVFYDIGSEWDLCELHYLEVQLGRVYSKQLELSDWILSQKTKLTEIKTEAQKLRSQIEQLDGSMTTATESLEELDGD